jgi:hypothetical protein
MSDPNTVDEADRFSALNYPEVSQEMKRVACHVTSVPGVFKREILISYLKNHSIKVDWLADNDRLVKMITSGALKIRHTEQLFDARRRDKVFLVDFEGYIATELENCSSDAMHRNVVRAVSLADTLDAQQYYAHLPTLSQ